MQRMSGLAWTLSLVWALAACGEETIPAKANNFRSLLATRNRELLRETTRYVEEHPDASDRDEAFVWSLETARRLGLESDAVALAEKCLKQPSVIPSVKTLAKQVLCLGLAKSKKLPEAIAAFQDTLQFSRFGGGNESLDLAVELAAQAGLLGDHAAAKKVYETLNNRLSLNAQVAEFCENRLRKLDLVGQEASELELTDLAGQPVTVSGLRGKVVLIDFWATNCPPCLAEFPKLKQLHADLHGKGFEIVGISLDDSRDLVDAFQSRAKLSWPLVVDAEKVKQAREKYRVRTIPSLFLVSPDGKIAQVDLKGDDLRAAVEGLLAESNPKR